MSSIVFIVIAALSSPAWAMTGFTVEICGEDVSIDAGASEVVISNSGGSEKLYSDCDIGIAGLGGNDAKVRTMDGGKDQIFVENAVIRATSGNVNGDIKFWATFDNPPTAESTALPFRRSQSATLKRGNMAATGDWFEISGWADNNEIYYGERKTIVCPFGPCATINIPTREEDWAPVSMTTPREIKGQFWFHFKNNNDKLNITHVKVDNPAGGGPPTPDSYSDGRISITPGMMGKMDDTVAQEKCPSQTTTIQDAGVRRFSCEMTMEMK